MSKIEVDAIDKQSGSTLTLGGSGTAVTLASGATQTGFGRSGSVNWDTTPKTATFTGVSGNGYFVNTTAGVVTANLPASPSAGDIVSISDYANTSITNNITVARNGSNIEGSASDLTIENNGIALTFIYVDGTRGWKVVNAGKEADKSGIVYMQAGGGTVTTCGNYKIHTFTGPGTFTVCEVGDIGTVEYLVVAGGGGGGAGCGGGGGGGAGGFRFYANPTCNPQSGPGAPRNGPAAIPVSVTSYPITVGAGGTGGTVTGPSCGTCGSNGNNSVFSTITSTAGGGAGSGNQPACVSTGNPGGSGGGNARNRGSAGSGNTPPVSPPQGSNGGGNSPAPTSAAAGGGGAMAVGQNANAPGGSPQVGGNGGAGAGITGFGSGNGECSSCVQYFSGGGGGATYQGCSATPTPNGIGGLGGGGNGALSSSLPAPEIAAGTGEAGTANTGGGGGGGSEVGGTDLPGANGGSGIVVIRYKFQ